MSPISWRSRTIFAQLWFVTVIALLDAVVGDRCKSDPPARKVMEPATVKAFATALLYSRLSGSVEKVHVNIGDRVKRGQLLAELAVPEVKAELALKRAQLDQVNAELSQAKLAVEPINTEITEARNGHGDASIAKARLEVAKAAIRVAEARVAVVQAKLSRLESLLQCATLQAPFDGVVTKRNISPGGPVCADTCASSQPLFVIEKTDRVRIAVRVPETYALLVEPNDEATIAFDSIPGKTFSAKVSRTAGVINPVDRTMLVEIDLPNQNGQLLPGMFGRATITLSAPSSTSGK